MFLEKINKNNLYNINYKCLFKIVVKNEICYGFITGYNSYMPQSLNGKGIPYGYYFRTINPHNIKEEIESNKWIDIELIEEIFLCHNLQ